MSSIKKCLVEKHDFTSEDPWRMFRIISEFVEGFEELSCVEKPFPYSVPPDSGRAQILPRYEGIAYLLAKEGFSIITGGGPGLMEAATRGARRAKGYSIGLNIQLPMNRSRTLISIRLSASGIFSCAK
jgi:hypothetical protein